MGRTQRSATVGRSPALKKKIWRQKWLNLEKCSFTIIAQDKVVPEKYSTFFKSVIAFGKIHIVDELEEMRRLVSELAEKYRPNHDEEKNKEIDLEFSALRMLVMEIEHITGKESKFLAAERREPGSSKNIVTD